MLQVSFVRIESMLSSSFLSAGLSANAHDVTCLVALLMISAFAGLKCLVA